MATVLNENLSTHIQFQTYLSQLCLCAMNVGSIVSTAGQPSDSGSMVVESGQVVVVTGDEVVLAVASIVAAEVISSVVALSAMVVEDVIIGSFVVVVDSPVLVDEAPSSLEVVHPLGRGVVTSGKLSNWHL